MAASGQPLHRTFSGSTHRIQDGSPWPNGQCSFRDLSAGAGAPTCGCRRFWLNVAGNLLGPDGERAWCFCGHHACFHEVHGVNAQGVGTGDEAQVDTDDALTRSRRQSDFASRALADPIFNSPTLEDVSPAGKDHAGLGIRHPPQSQSQNSQVRLWQALNGFARQQEVLGEDGTRLPSTAVPSVADETRWSPARSMHDHMLQQHRAMGPPVNIPPAHPHDGRTDDYSATEVATPSVAGTPDFRTNALPAVTYTTPSHLTPPRQDQRPHTSHVPVGQLTSPKFANPSGSRLAAGLMPSLSLQEMRNTIQEYGRRLNVLENISFSQMPHDDIQEKFELMDGRLLDLEHWRIDQDNKAEQAATPSPVLGQPSKGKRRSFLEETNSLASDGSFDSNAAARTETVVLATLAASAETRPRIDALEARVEDLERAAQPSFSRPWHVQVVLLPFGRRLPGVWFSSSESTEHLIRSTQRSEEWTGAPPAVTSSFMSSNGAWTTDSIRAWANETHDEWLSPKACGPSGSVFQRLSSRGMVRDVTFTSPDAYHILKTISCAFGNLLNSEELDELPNVDKFRALQEPFIPLRKVRKSSRLRFLTQAEMVTSTTWTASFLDSSIFMRLSNGQRRLYVTTPAAYLQNTGIDWSWPMIRALPIHDAGEAEQAASARGDLIESCWTFNDGLDRIISLHSSFATHEDSQWGDDSHASTQREDAQGSSHPSLPTLAHIRAASFPSASSADVHMPDISNVPRRSVASFTTTTDRTQAQPRPPRPVDFPSKRRRISTSPELERRGVNFTPATSHRLSREPPSPGITSSAGGGGVSGISIQNVSAGQTHSQATSSNPQFRHKRGTTPFAYATPHSNLESTGCIGDDGDTEVNTVMSEREWQGVQDGPGEMMGGGAYVRSKMASRRTAAMAIPMMNPLVHHDDVTTNGEEDDDDEEEEEGEDEGDDDEEEEEEEPTVGEYISRSRQKMRLT